MASAAAAPISFDAVGKIMLQLLLPFVLGQLLRPWIGAWVHRRKALLKWVDQGSILLVVYTAFSEAVNEGLWSNTPIPALLGLLTVCCIILVLAMAGSLLLGRLFKFDVADRITLLFCGSKEPGQRYPDGPGDLCRTGRGRHRAAADAVSPDPADGVRRAGHALRQAPGLIGRGGRAQYWVPGAKLRKRVLDPWKVRRTVPIGPLRCLPMMISAEPLSGESGL